MFVPDRVRRAAVCARRQVWAVCATGLPQTEQHDKERRDHAQQHVEAQQDRRRLGGEEQCRLSVSAGEIKAIGWGGGVTYLSHAANLG